MITSLHGDTTDLLQTIAPGSVQQIVTSPPYFGLRSYAIPPTAWPEVVYCPLIGLPEVTIPAMACQLGAEPDPLAYIAHLVHVFRLARPCLRDDGTLWVNLADSYSGGGPHHGTKNLGKSGTNKGSIEGTDRYIPGIPDKNLLGIPARAALALQADGWCWRSEIIWHAPNKMPESVRDRPTRAHEMIYLFGNGPRYYFDQDAVREPLAPFTKQYLDHDWSGGDGRVAKERNDRDSLRSRLRAEQINPAGRNKRDVWSIPTTPMPAALRGADEAHYAAWPPALVEIMIKAGSANKACAQCGAAYIRQVEREASGMSFGVVRDSEQVMRNDIAKRNGRIGESAVLTTGFAPACACNAAAARCVVLDPFAGTGTTGAVAESLGRDAILIDLGYETLQAKRTDNLQITMEAYL